MSHTSTDQSLPRRNGGRPASERKNVRGEATRRLILEAAERLFAERGISGVPLRDIGLAAGQRNNAAVQYHFGDRDEVVKAILEFRGAESEATRAGIVADFIFGRSTPDVPDVVNAFVSPLAIHLREGNHYLAFLSSLITEEGGYEGLYGLEISTGASVMTLQTLLERLLPEIPRTILNERWAITMTSAVHTLARYQSALRKRERLPEGLDVLLADLVAFLSAGLTAPTIAFDPRAVSARPSQ